MPFAENRQGTAMPAGRTRFKPGYLGKVGYRLVSTNTCTAHYCTSFAPYSLLLPRLQRATGMHPTCRTRLGCDFFPIGPLGRLGVPDTANIGEVVGASAEFVG